MISVFDRVENILEKAFSLSYNIFITILVHGCLNLGLCGEMLHLFQKKPVNCKCLKNLSSKNQNRGTSRSSTFYLFCRNPFVFSMLAS